VRRDWRWVFTLVFCWSCAGDLEDPDRFAFLANRGGTSAGGSGATGAVGGTGTGSGGTRAGAGGAGGAGGTGSGGRAGGAGGTAGAGGARAGGTGAAGKGTAGSSAGTDPPACLTTLFAKSCATGVSCHGAGAPQVSLETDGLAARLIDKMPSSSSMCVGKIYVSSTGGSSLLADKLMNPPPCGSQMPIGPALSAADLKCVTDWVDAVGGK
jgi:hypothetical protein